MPPDPNPNPCTGVPTACCDNELPEQLKVTIATDCGTFSGSIPIIAPPTLDFRWSGVIKNVQCKTAPGGGCVTDDFAASAACVSGVWAISCTRQGAGYFGPPASSSCAPNLSKTFLNQSCCFSSVTVTFS